MKKEFKSEREKILHDIEQKKKEQIRLEKLQEKQEDQGIYDDSIRENIDKLDQEIEKLQYEINFIYTDD